MKLAKKLQLLKSQGSLASKRETQELKQSLNELTSYLGQLGSKIEKLVNVIASKQINQQKIKQKEPTPPVQKKQNYFSDISNLEQSRFKVVNVPLPKITKQDDNKAQIQILMNWLGQVCRVVFSAGFTLFKSGQLQANKVKAYCSQNFLRNILLLSQKYDIGHKIYELINQTLKQQLLPYYSHKYPQSQQKYMSKKFSDLLIERNQIKDNQNDLVFRSNIKFTWEKSGNYNSEIMEFLNYIIRLPDQIVNNQESGLDITLEQQFVKDMERIFQKVQSQSQKINMLKYDIKSPINSRQNQITKIQKNEEYAQKVRSYTNYQINQKLPQNLNLYSQYQIRAGNLKLHNSALMRVVTKWCLQLWQNFDQSSFLNRQNAFRMKDGSESYLNKFQMNVLNLYLQQQKKIIIQKIKDIQKNNYFQQSQFGKIKVDKKLLKFSKQQAIVGQFASSIFKLNQNYLINYVNWLIHGINKAAHKFQMFQIAYLTNSEQRKQLQSFYNENNQKFNHQLLEKIQHYFTEFNFTGFQASSKTPQLIGFRIGDLLRCKCVSKESQILALYKQMQRLSHKDPKNIKIIRVKNKLNEATRDILMNFLYKQKILVQMQLTIKSQKSKFIQYSNKFNHYLYQMKRSQFGPIVQMCTIWASQDFKAQFYLNKLQELNIRKKTPKALCCNETQNKKIIQLPFGCDSCQSFYYDCTSYQKHMLCEKCKTFTCYQCKLQVQPGHIFKTIPIQKNGININQRLDTQSLRFLKQVPEKGGALLNLKSKQRKMIIFSTVCYNNQYYVFQSTKQNQKLKLIEKFKQKKLSKTFLKDNLLITSPQIQGLIQNIPLETVQKNYFIPNYLKETMKKQNKSIILIKKNIDQNIFVLKDTEVQDKNWASVINLNFSQNNIKQIDILPIKFPHIRIAVLTQNKIQNMDSKQINNWQSIQQLYLSENAIKSTKDIIKNFKNLVQLDLSNNCIQNVQDSISNLQCLSSLDLSGNPLKQIADSFCKMRQIKTLTLSQTLLQKLPQTIGNLETLVTLNVTHTNISALPESIGNLKLLRKLNLMKNNILVLPDSICKLSSLNLLRVSSNQNLTKLPVNMGKLRKLRTLDIWNTQIAQLPQSCQNIKKLQQLILAFSKITGLPQWSSRLEQLSNLIIQIQQQEQFYKNLLKIKRLKVLQLYMPVTAQYTQRIQDLCIERQIEFTRRTT